MGVVDVEYMDPCHADNTDALKLGRGRSIADWQL